MLVLVSLLKAYGEILALSLLGRGVLRLALRQRAEGNVVYRICAGITRPWLRFARWIMPRFVPDRFLGIVATIFVLVFWVAASTQKIEMCKDESAQEEMCRDVRQAVSGP